MTTSLEVLNHVLNVVGESPVSDYNSTHPTATSVRTQIVRVNKELQKRGWYFNTEYDLTLTPNELGQILVPSTTLFIDPIDPYSSLVRRGSKLYDPVEHTFIIDASVSVNCVLLLSIEDLVESAAMYVMHKTALDYYVNDDGDNTKAIELEKRVATAWAALQSEELKAANVSAMNRPAVQALRYRMQQYGNSYNPRWPGGRPV